ncbi:S8 family serine peptidase [bacterium]|nr:S8 family serine peptidase [bacterium]
MKFIILGVSVWCLVGQLRAESFPAAGLLPKAETGVLKILKVYPEYDGRGIKVAIFDSGVDPGAEGLRQTPDGRLKVIDLVDATGSGDIDISKEEVVKDGSVVGLTGRCLALPKEIKDGASVRMGIKAAWELFPGALVSRLKKERLEEFRAEHEKLEVSVRQDIALSKKEREARLKELASAMKGYQDPGPIFDCVVYQHDDQWRVVVDTDEDGDLAEEQSLTDYQHEHKYASFGEQAQLNYTVTLDEAGKALAIVVPSNMHGTHVSGIVGGYYENELDLNGLAPGVQIVSVKIGDTRLDGMETGSAIIRGLEVARAHGCQLINMSYGEPTRLPNRGRVLEKINELVYEHGVIFVSSAGNAGPALSTLGAPGGTTSSVIGVGAYVTPAMMKAGYAMRSTHSDLAYTWSSRGPAKDGSLGVSICAPGGAYSPVPAYTLRRNQHANGTSMSSPNACGSLAVLLSGLEAEGIGYSPRSVKRVVENTAEPLAKADVFSDGQGLLRVDRALEVFREHRAIEETRYVVSVPSRDQALGLYLREAYDTETEQTFRVSVNPTFRKDTPNEDKLQFNRRLRLESSVPWISCPEHLFLTHRRASFLVETMPGALPPGVHAGEVLAYVDSSEGSGPVFRFPVTLIRSEVSDRQWSRSGILEPGEIGRHFLSTEGVTWMDVTLTNRSENAQNVVLHCMQTLPQRRHPESGQRLRGVLQPNEVMKRTLPIAPGHTLEVALASFWSNESLMDYELKLAFHGLDSSSDTVHLSKAAPTARVEVRSLREREVLQPSAKLTHWQAWIQPKESQVEALIDERLPVEGFRQRYEATVTYAVSLSKGASVVPRFPGLNARLYESDVQNQLYTITDGNGRRVDADDGWEPGMVTLKKGDYLIHYHWLNEDIPELEALTKLPLTLEGRLSSPLGLQVYDDGRREANFGAATMRKGEGRPMHLAMPDSGAPGNLPIEAVQLVGSLKLHPDAPESVARVIYTLPHSKSSSKATNEEEREGPLEEKVAELAKSDTVKMRKEDHLKIVALCDKLLAEIDEDVLALHRGRRHDEDDDEAKKAKERFDREFEILTDTLYRKCRAIAYHDGEREKAGETFEAEPFEEAFAALGQWVDTKETDYILAHIRSYRRHARFGEALQLLNKHMKSAVPTRLLHDKRVKILGRLGWTLWADHEEQWNRRRFVPFLKEEQSSS